MLKFVLLVAVFAVTAANTLPNHLFSAKIAEHKNRNRINNDDLPLTEHIFRIPVDHFSPQDGRFVNFTYVRNLEYYQPNGPIFIFVDDRGYSTTEWIVRGLMVDIARDLGAALITAEHRYFGANIPTPSASFEDLQFMTVDQALGDLSVLINAARRDLGTTGRVILWSTGYGAMLATNARKKYPHLVDGVWSSSATFRAEAIDTSYLDNLSVILHENGGLECAERVSTAFDVLAILIWLNEAEYLQQRLRLCDVPNTENQQEVGLLVWRFVSLISQYIRSNELNGIQTFCRDMAAIPEDPLNSLLRWIDYVYGQPECLNLNYENVVAAVGQTSWSNLTAVAAWSRLNDFIECTQIGGLRVTSDFAKDIFPANLITTEFQYQYCSDILGEQYNATLLAESVDSLNLSYGGQDQMSPRIVFTTAGLDPNIHHSVLEYDPAESVVVFLPHNSAGADLHSLSVNDSVNMTYAKTTIRELVTHWARA